MKVQILVVSSNRPGGRINDLIHRGFFEACPLHLAWYGPGEEGPLSFDQGRPLLEVVAALKPLLVVFNMKKRVEHWVHPAAVRKLSVPTAMIEVDYCYSGGMDRCALQRLRRMVSGGGLRPRLLPPQNRCRAVRNRIAFLVAFL